jgi:DNA-binding beta-propeller fold protein YncE
MKRVLFSILLALPAAGDATCPSDVPVVTLAPQVVGAYRWSAPVRPLGDPCISHLIVERKNENGWYAGGPNGLYVSRDGGKSWVKKLSGRVKTMRLTREGDNQIPFLYVAIGKELHLSRDRGRTFRRVFRYPHAISSLLVVGTTLYAGAHADAPGMISGIYVSDLLGRNMSFERLDPSHGTLVVWDIAHDPKSNTLYASTEVSVEKPKIYHPPFFRSTDGGKTWKDVSGKFGADGKWNGINHHVVEIAVRNDGFVYAMGEGSGVYGSADKGESWVGPINSPGLGHAMWVDKNKQTRVYLGRVKFKLLTGGMFVSDDGGRSATAIGLDGASIADIAMNGEGTKLYVAAYGSGIYTSPAPHP